MSRTGCRTALTRRRELTWFAKHFVGEQSFVLLTWEGLFGAGRELPPVRGEAARRDSAGVRGADRRRTPCGFGASAESAAAREVRDRGERELTRARQWGDQLGLHTTGDYHQNWGGLDEKWLRGADQSWYYMTPQRRVVSLARPLECLGGAGSPDPAGDSGRPSRCDGTLMATFGEPPAGRRRNEFHNDPRRLTGPRAQERHHGPGRAGRTRSAGRIDVADRHGLLGRGAGSASRGAARLDRLKGTFYGPEPYEDFQWTADDLPRVVLRTDAGAIAVRTGKRQVDAFSRRWSTRSMTAERSELLAASLLEKEDALERAVRSIWAGAAGTADLHHGHAQPRREPRICGA